MCHDDDTGIGRYRSTRRKDRFSGQDLEIDDREAMQGLTGLPKPVKREPGEANAGLSVEQKSNEICIECGKEINGSVFGGRCAKCFSADVSPADTKSRGQEVDDGSQHGEEVEPLRFSGGKPMMFEG